MKIKSLLWPSITLTLFFIVVSILFPLAIYGIAQITMPHQANGSLIRNSQGQIRGSDLIGQSFAKPEYFHPRPSAAGSGYDGANSGGTNLGPTSDKLINGIPDDPATNEVDESYQGIKQLAEAYRRENGLAPNVQLPADAVTRSASGLDPHISVANAQLQIARVAKARGLSAQDVQKLVDAHTIPRFGGLYGEPTVHVLHLNLALDEKR